MKVVVTGTRGIPDVLGGVETHCQELYPLLVERGHDVTLIRRTSYCHTPASEAYKGVSLYDIDVPKTKSLEAISHTFKAILAARFTFRADVIHIHAIGPALLTPFARLLGMKVVFTHHGPDYDRDKWGTLAKLVLRTGEAMGALFAQEVIVISEVINTTLKEKYRRKDAHLIYNGVPKPERIATHTYLDSLGVEPQKYVFAMGRFVPEKNFHQLIEAFKPLATQGYKLVLAGDNLIEDAYSAQLKQQALDHGVVLTGFIKGAPLQELLSHARLFVLPSSHEGLPIALLEAMSYQLPVVVSDIPANVAVGLPAEHYFPLNQIAAMTSCMEQQLQQQKARISYDMQAYDWSLIAQQVERVYSRLLTNAK